MLVLSIIGIILAAFLLYLFIDYVNKYSQEKYSYQFFNWGNYIATAVGYALIYFGQSWYWKAFLNSGDTLNGLLLVLIGILLVVIVIRQR